MPRKKKPWFRVYAEIVFDEKLRPLPPAQRWVWIAVLALARNSPEPGRLIQMNGKPVTFAVIVDAAKVPDKDVKTALTEFQQAEMLHVESGVYVVTHWNARQFESDDVTTRANASRDRNRNGSLDLDDYDDGSNVANPERCNVAKEQKMHRSNVAGNGLSNVAPFACESRDRVSESQSNRNAYDNTVTTPDSLGSRGEFINPHPSSGNGINSSASREGSMPLPSEPAVLRPLSQLREQAVETIVKITGSPGSRNRFRQLYEKCDRHGLLLQVWEHAKRKTIEKLKAEQCPNPGGYFCTIIVDTLRDDYGIVVDIGSAAEREEIKGLMQASLNGADSDPDPQSQSP